MSSVDTYSGKLFYDTKKHQNNHHTNITIIKKV